MSESDYIVSKCQVTACYHLSTCQECKTRDFLKTYVVVSLEQRGDAALYSFSLRSGTPWMINLQCLIPRMSILNCFCYIQYLWVEALSLPATPSFETYEILGCQPQTASAWPNKYIFSLTFLAILIINEFTQDFPKVYSTQKPSL